MHSLTSLGGTVPLSHLVDSEGVARLRISDDITVGRPEETVFSNPLAVQRLLTLASMVDHLVIAWEKDAADKLLDSPSIYPLVAVLVCLKNAKQELDGLSEADCQTRITGARRNALGYRLKSDVFADCQIAICADSLGYSRCPDFYDQDGGELLRGEDMEALVEDVIMPHIQVSGRGALYHSRLAISSIISELFENTHLHGRTKLDNRIVAPNCIRGLIVRRVSLHRGGTSLSKKEARPSFGLELSVFDCGIGYYTAFSRQELDASIKLDDEWRVVQECLRRHYDDPLPDSRLTHHGLGLYKVLRAIKIMKGRFELRTGRIHGYRSFLEGEIPLQLEPEDSTERPGMPKPVLLDSARKYLAKPTKHEMLVGAVVSVVLPLES